MTGNVVLQALLAAAAGLVGVGLFGALSSSAW